MGKYYYFVDNEWKKLSIVWFRFDYSNNSSCFVLVISMVSFLVRVLWPQKVPIEIGNYGN